MVFFSMPEVCMETDLPFDLPLLWQKKRKSGGGKLRITCKSVGFFPFAEMILLIEFFYFLEELDLL